MVGSSLSEAEGGAHGSEQPRQAPSNPLRPATVAAGLLGTVVPGPVEGRHPWLGSKAPFARFSRASLPGLVRTGGDGPGPEAGVGLQLAPHAEKPHGGQGPPPPVAEGLRHSGGGGGGGGHVARGAAEAGLLRLPPPPPRSERASERAPGRSLHLAGRRRSLRARSLGRTRRRGGGAMAGHSSSSSSNSCIVVRKRKRKGQVERRPPAPTLFSPREFKGGAGASRRLVRHRRGEDQRDGAGGAPYLPQVGLAKGGGLPRGRGRDGDWTTCKPPPHPPPRREAGWGHRRGGWSWLGWQSFSAGALAFEGMYSSERAPPPYKTKTKTKRGVEEKLGASQTLPPKVSSMGFKWKL